MVSLVELEFNNLPIRFASGCLVNYEDHLSCSLSATRQETKAGGRWKSELIKQDRNGEEG